MCPPLLDIWDETICRYYVVYAEQVDVCIQIRIQIECNSADDVECVVSLLALKHRHEDKRYISVETTIRQANIILIYERTRLMRQIL